MRLVPTKGKVEEHQGSSFLKIGFFTKLFQSILIVSKELYIILDYSLNMITLLVNDTQVEIEKGANLDQLIRKVNPKVDGIAVAVNNQIIPKYSWYEQRLNQNDSILIIKATQGG